MIWQALVLLGVASAGAHGDSSSPSHHHHHHQHHRHHHKKPPAFPKAYKAEYTYTIPYTATYLPQPLSYPVKLWVNDVKSMRRIDVYDGMDVEIDRNGKQYIQTPRMDKFVCRLAGAEAEGVGASADAEPAASGSTRRLLAESDAPERPRGTSSYDAALHALKHDQAQRGAGKGPKPKQYGGLPTLDGFTFEKDVDFNNIKAEKWTYKLKVEDTVGHYEYIVTKEGRPLRLHMLGGELALESHFDEYVLDFLSFEALDAEDEAPFTLPKSCADLDGARAGRPVSLVLAALVPGTAGGQSEYDDFSDHHGRQHADAAEYRKRRALFQHHAAAVKAHNLAAEHPYTLELNRFADWTDDEYRALLGRRRSGETRSAVQKLQAGGGADGGHRRLHTRPGGFTPVPGTVDWRGSGAVGPVKDQGVCGSCWSFSASQVLSAAWWRETGEYVSFSEQQIMDCSWGYGENHACDGGDEDLAVNYIADAGGAYKEKDYPYKGADDYCRAKGVRAIDAEPVAMKPEVVYIKQYDSQAVKDAVATKGPLSIGIDASCIPFRFYSSGVLSTSECGTDPDSIDHAVLLVGYGEEDGTPYWLVKNEWSAHWGDEGYIKIDRAHDCAVSTQAFYVEMR